MNVYFSDKMTYVLRVTPPRRQCLGVTVLGQTLKACSYVRNYVVGARSNILSLQFVCSLLLDNNNKDDNNNNNNNNNNNLYCNGDTYHNNNLNIKLNGREFYVFQKW